MIRRMVRWSAVPRAAVLLGVLLGILAGPVRAENPAEALARGGYPERLRAVEAIAAAGDPRWLPALRAMLERRLFVHRPDDRLVIVEDEGADRRVVDALSGVSLGAVPAETLEVVRINNPLRRALAAAIARLSLRQPDRQARLAAVRELALRPAPEMLEALEAALAAESDAVVQAELEYAFAINAVAAPAGSVAPRRLVEAVGILGARGGREALAMLDRLPPKDDPALAAAVERARARIEGRLLVREVLQTAAYGLSLGSVLLLAAVGLAVTFGVMGVINLAHGELVMLGAYVTFVVQEAMRAHAPQLLDHSLFAALPLAFGVAGLAGILIERSIVRFLYGRPLETLLATFGVSLVLQQAVRSLFGPTNREVANPSWMSGAVEVGGVLLTWNRVWIFLFALAVFVALLALLRWSRFGLEMRAVTQNREIAAAMGIRTPRVDMLTFGLGSGIAGLAGVALSQIDNVSPNLGQNYIVDSFLVVVFGGVGSLWGTLAGAFTLGIVNKSVEPWTGAVFGKVLVLAFVILFIQRRPRGLFALRGRVAESAA